MKNIFAEEYAREQAIKARYEAASAARDAAGMETARAEHKAHQEGLQAKGRAYRQTYELYSEAREQGNEYIDLHETIWDDQVERLIASLRECGVEKFTFSSTWTKAVETAWLFTQNSCVLEGLVELNGPAGGQEKRHGYLFSLRLLPASICTVFGSNVCVVYAEKELAISAV